MNSDQQAYIMAKLEMIESPLPHPELLEGYNNLYPNAAEKIINNSLEESNHRRILECKEQRNNFVSKCMGLIFAFLLSVALILLGFILIIKGHTVIGSIFAGIFGITLISLFIPSNSSEVPNVVNTMVNNKEYQQDNTR